MFDKHKSIIIGIDSVQLSTAEKKLLEKSKPLGVILFTRNCQDVKQIAKLTKQIRESIGLANAPLMIDQEGAAVTRLKPPLWPDIAPYGFYGRLAKDDLEQAKELLKISTRAIAGMLIEVGVNVITSPCLDLVHKGAHPLIGQRAFSEDVNIAVELAQLVVDGFKQQGIMPIVKHLPGHGRAMVDSHHKLPRIDCELQQLLKTDFLAFQLIKHSDLMMVGHLLFEAIDKTAALSVSKRGIDYLRQSLGVKNKLISDCITMQALGTDLIKAAINVKASGIDILLCSKASISEFKKLLELADELSIEEYNSYNFPKASYQAIDAEGKKIDYRQDLAMVNRQLGYKVNDSMIDHTAD